MSIEGIILAAGLSTRANSFKMTLPFNGKTVIESTIDNMLKLCGRIVIVGGYNIEALKPIMSNYRDVELIFNENYIEGMYSSVKKGMSWISADRFFLTPGDYPMILPEVYQELLGYDAPVVIPTFEGRRGHPVLFDRAIINQVMNQAEHKTLRTVIDQNKAIMAPVDCRGVLMDLDTIEDYELLLKQLG